MVDNMKVACVTHTARPSRPTLMKMSRFSVIFAAFRARSLNVRASRRSGSYYIQRARPNQHESLAELLILIELRRDLVSSGETKKTLRMRRMIKIADSA